MRFVRLLLVLACLTFLAQATGAASLFPPADDDCADEPFGCPPLSSCPMCAGCGHLVIALGACAAVEMSPPVAHELRSIARDDCPKSADPRELLHVPKLLPA